MPNQNYVEFFLHRLTQINWNIVILATILSIIGILNVHSATDGEKTLTSIFHLLLGLSVMIVIAVSPNNWIMRMAIPLYLFGVFLLIMVAIVGTSAKGAQRWLDFGILRFQPSEIMKFAVPLFLSWIIHYLHERSQWIQVSLMLAILATPVFLIIRQPDLGTAILITVAGLAVIYLAGLPWKIIIAGTILTFAYAPIHWNYFMEDYQKNRVLTLISPYSDPLGKGYHTIQSTIAVGSGGILGKGFQDGTQTQLNFLPEPHTDFAFAVLAEEHGFVGFMILLGLFLLLIFNGLKVSLNSYTKFGRVLAGALTITIFVYFFINMGMVIGILPVVGVPLPFVSYGGTSTVITYVMLGLILSCSRKPNENELIRPLI